MKYRETPPSIDPMDPIGHVGFVRLGQDVGGLHQQNSMINSKGVAVGI